MIYRCSGLPAVGSHFYHPGDYEKHNYQIWALARSLKVQINAAHHLEQNQAILGRDGWLDGFISARLNADES